MGRGVLRPDLAAAHITLDRHQPSGAGIFGVDRRLFTRSLSGLGLAFGVRFRPGGFRPFWQAPISQLTDRVVPAARLFGPRAEKTRQAIMAVGAFDADDGQMTGF